MVSYLVYTLLAADTGLVNSVLKSLGMKSNQLVSGAEILAFYFDFLQHLEGNRLLHDHLPFQHRGHQPGLL